MRKLMPLLGVVLLATQLLAQQKSKAELAALIALHYWLQKQKEVKAVESTTTNWTKRS